MNVRERALAIATTAVVVVGAGWTYALSPALDRWREADTRVEKLAADKAACEELLERAPALREERRAIELAIAPQGGPSEAIPGFLDRVRALGEAAGIRPSTLRYLRADKVENAFAELRFELRTQAPLKQVQDFLVRLAGAGQPVRIASLTIAPQPDGTVDADLALVALAPLEAAEEGRR